VEIGAGSEYGCDDEVDQRDVCTDESVSSAWPIVEETVEGGQTCGRGGVSGAFCPDETSRGSG